MEFVNFMEMFRVYSLAFGKPSAAKGLRFTIMGVVVIGGLLNSFQGICQRGIVDSFNLYGDVTVAIDHPQNMHLQHNTRIIVFALPNGNTIAQTMGKKMQEGDDWHYDIQHIRAQTDFLRTALPNENIVVAYLYNQYKSWPSWKQKHPDYRQFIPAIIDSVCKRIPSAKKTIELSSHSGGGSFIFGYLDGVSEIPSDIKRITFIDSNYGYDSSYAPKFSNWLKKDKNNKLLVFAYNDSVALYNGKAVVSAKGGTWYRSRRMMEDIGNGKLIDKSSDSIQVYQTKSKNLAFFLKDNPHRGIYHTQQVELNGFIHAALYGTKKENKGYKYWGKRSYTHFIE